MGRIETTDKTSTWLLSERSIIGRSNACTVRLRDACVSAEHALLRWNGRAWELQDLGSRNGTFVASRCIVCGGTARNPEAPDSIAGGTMTSGRPNPRSSPGVRVTRSPTAKQATSGSRG